MKLVLPKDFPASPPQGRLRLISLRGLLSVLSILGYFLTKIFHPNVAKNGAICVNTLKKDWKSTHGIKHILMVCVCTTSSVLCALHRIDYV